MLYFNRPSPKAVPKATIEICASVLRRNMASPLQSKWHTKPTYPPLHAELQPLLEQRCIHNKECQSYTMINSMTSQNILSRSKTIWKNGFCAIKSTYWLSTKNSHYQTSKEDSAIDTTYSESATRLVSVGSSRKKAAPIV